MYQFIDNVGGPHLYGAGGRDGGGLEFAKTVAELGLNLDRGRDGGVPVQQRMTL